MSGFSPIITTGSSAHQDAIKALGATNVIDRGLTGEAFAAALQKITQQPIEVAFDVISTPSTQAAAWSSLARGGRFVLTLQPVVKEEEGKGRTIIATYGSPHAEPNQAMCRAAWTVLGRWLQDGVIKVCKVQSIEYKTDSGYVSAEQSRSLTERA